MNPSIGASDRTPESETVTLDGVDVRFRFVRANGIDLHVAEAGPADGPTIVLLHGFPEFWYGWREQIPTLARAGFRVLAPDQRGYNLSDKPTACRDYRLDELGRDVLELLDACECGDDVSLVGHDWGGGVAWWLAAEHPDRFRRLVILNVPHLFVFRRHLRRNPRQMLRSWYIAVFQLPWLPEWLLSRRDHRMCSDGLVRSSRPGTFTEDDLERYRTAWSRPGSMRAMIDWYRALFRRPPIRPQSPRIRVPTRIVWGLRDRFLGREMLAPSAALCDDVEVFEIESATHWVHHEEPQIVNRRILEFVGAGDPSPTEVRADA